MQLRRGLRGRDFTISRAITEVDFGDFILEVLVCEMGGFTRKFP